MNTFTVISTLCVQTYHMLKGRNMWYVVQVTSGQEMRTASLIRKLVSQQILDECFVPQVDTPKRIAGEWTHQKRLLVPGYVFLVTRHVETLSKQLSGVPTFTRLLGNDDVFVPLDTMEVAWVDRFTHAGHRIIDMSTGTLVGDSIVVASGPLAGQTGLITKVDRHKRLAYVDMTMFGRTTSVKMGLELVSKQ